MINTDKTIKRRNIEANTPRQGVSHRHNNLGTSPQKLSDKVSQPLPDTKKISRLPITKGRRKVDNETRLPILGYKFVIPKFLRLF